MVTAGIFMVARMSPLFEFSDAALSFVIVIGAVTAFFMGVLGIVQNDIKRVVAYSTLSQLGYMTVALGASAYSVAIFHLMTHAFFKALLFLAAGSVIVAMHHEQDIRYMGGLWKKMPVTWITALIGTLASVGTPFFSGFYSKDSIIGRASRAASARPGDDRLLGRADGVRHGALLFRMFFLVFHGARGQKPHHATTTAGTMMSTAANPRIAGGDHRAAGAAGDPVGDHRLRDDHRCCPAISSQSIFVDVLRQRQWRTSPRSPTALPRWHCTASPAPFWLLVRGGTAAFLYLMRPTCGAVARAFRRAVPAARQQVLPRPAQRDRVRQRRAPARHGVVERR
jgi:hypothetical protein